MSKIKLLTDTGCDMLEELKKIDVDYIPLYVTFDEKTYWKQIEEVSIPEFYQRIEDKNSSQPKTSCPSVEDYADIFYKYVNEGDSVLMIALNSKFSGACQAAELTKGIIKEDKKDAEIEIFDSGNCTYTQYVMCKKAKEMIDEGHTIEEIKEVLEVMKVESRVFMYVDDLSSLSKSGRVSNLSAQLATILNIKPILELKDGVLEAKKKVKGANKALSTIISDLDAFLEGKNITEYKIGIVHGNRVEDAKELKEMIKDKYKIGDIDICQLGVCIGVHAGPTLLGIGIVKYLNF